MLSIIAWRNVWRNKARSLVVIGAMVLGVWALAFGGSFFRSFLISYIQESIRFETSNGQIHHPEFSTDHDIRYTLSDPERIVDELQSHPEVEAATVRSITNGMISSPRQATGVRIVGIDPATETKVTTLDTLLAEGDFLPDELSNPVLIGQRLAEKLQVRLKSRVILTFQDVNGHITAGRFRVAGILDATSITINETSAFVRREDLNRLTGVDNAVHEIAYTTKEGTDDERLATQLQAQFPQARVQSWHDLAPALVFMEQWMGASLMILIVIIMIALAFGIINTMLMAVLERVRELGVLMALGMKRSRVFLMIMLETIFLSLAGGPLGLVAGYVTTTWLGKRGIDLTDYSQGLEAIGYSSILYPTLAAADYIQIAAGVVITAIIASIYPAWKAIRYKPVEAIHTI